MGDQDQQNGQGQSDQQGQIDGQSQANAQTPPADGAQIQTEGQSGDSGQQGGSGENGKALQSTQTPGLQAGAYRLSLTEAQRKKLVEEGVLELSEEQYTGGVRHQVETLRKRATTAEKKLSDIASAQADADRKALEEQNRYKELYEQEHQARETDRVARKDDLVRSRFLLAATKAGVVDPIRCAGNASAGLGFPAPVSIPGTFPTPIGNRNLISAASAWSLPGASWWILFHRTDCRSPMETEKETPRRAFCASRPS